jgi:hypothetical protein
LAHQVDHIYIFKFLQPIGAYLRLDWYRSASWMWQLRIIRMLMELIERLRQWLNPKPEGDTPADENEDHSSLADLARLLTECEPPA